MAFPDSRSGALRNYTERYRYDAVGNIESMRHIAGPLGSWTRTYDYETATNRLTGTDIDNPGRAVTYDYDTHGSMSNLNAAPDGFDLRWDWNNMIHTIDLGGGGRAWYQYGADKQRCRKRIDKQNGTPGYWERVYLPGFELDRRYSGADPGAPIEEIETHHLFEHEQRVLMVDDVITAGDANHPRADGIAVQEQIPDAKLGISEYQRVMGKVISVLRRLKGATLAELKPAQIAYLAGRSRIAQTQFNVLVAAARRIATFGGTDLLFLSIYTPRFEPDGYCRLG